MNIYRVATFSTIVAGPDSFLEFSPGAGQLRRSCFERWTGLVCGD